MPIVHMTVPTWIIRFIEPWLTPSVIECTLCRIIAALNLSREPYLKVVGWKTCGMLFIYFTAPFSWLTYWVFADPSMLIKGWPLFTLPFVIYSLIKSSFMFQAIMEHHPKQLERIIQSESAYQDPQTWREASQTSLWVLRFFVHMKWKRNLACGIMQC